MNFYSDSRSALAAIRRPGMATHLLEKAANIAARSKQLDLLWIPSADNCADYSRFIQMQPPSVPILKQSTFDFNVFHFHA